MLELENLHSGYGRMTVLHGVSLTVQPGELVVIIGPNGAGKTTLLRTIMGQLRPKTGTISLHGKRLNNLPVAAVVRSGLAMVPEGRRVFATLTVRENLAMGAYTRASGEAEQLSRVFGLFPRLKERQAQAAGTLSGGEQQMLAIGRALMAAPSMLLLDEPSMGLAPVLVREIFSIIAELKSLGTTMLLVEQNARMALAVADRGLVLESGRIITENVASDLLDSPEIAQAYLGV